MPFVEGQQIRAVELRGSFPLVGAAAGDIEISNTIDWEPISGCQVIVEPRTTYAIAGYLAFDASANSHIAFQLQDPPGAFGDWGMCTLDGNTVTDSVGAGSYLRASHGEGGGFGDDFIIAAGSSVSSGAQVALARGWVSVGAAGGILQVAFTQALPHADITRVKEGSWIKLTKIGG